MHPLSPKLGAFFKDKYDKIVILQWPNWPLWMAILASIGARLSEGTVRVGLRAAFIIVMGYWAYSEITQGVNSWRKWLGLAVLSLLIWNTLQRLT